jgi:YD repeat-containing protein
MPGSCQPPDPLPRPSAPDYTRTGSYTVTVPDETFSYGHIEWEENYQSLSNQTGTLPRTKGTGAYGYKARACMINAGCGPWSSYKTVVVVKAPDKPSLEEFSPGACDKSLKVKWSAGSNYPASSYKSHTKYYELEESQHGNSWTITTGEDAQVASQSISIEIDTDYSFRVRAYYKWQGYTSAKSSWTSAESFDAKRCTPDAVTDLALTQENPLASATSLVAQWKKPNLGVSERYRVQFQKEGDSAWTTACDKEDRNFDNDNGYYLCEYADPDRGENYRARVLAYNQHMDEVEDGEWSSTTGVHGENGWQYVKHVNPGVPGRPVIEDKQINKQDGQYKVGFKLTWGAVDGAEYYEISENGGDWKRDDAGISIDTETEEVTKSYERQLATDYSYRVHACNPDELCGVASEGSHILNVPAAPGAIEVESTGDYGRDHTLSWPVPAGAVDTYKLSDDGGDTWRTVNVTDSDDGQAEPSTEPMVSTDITDALAGTDRGYRVKACNDYCGPASPALTYWMPEAVSAPQIDTYNPQNRSLEFSWPEVSGAHHYRVEKRVKDEDGWKGWSPVDFNEPLTDTTYTPTVEEGKTYNYKVAACNGHQVCGAPAAIGAHTMAPAAPTEISSAGQPTPESTTEVKLTWPAAGGEPDGYRVQRKNLTTDSGFEDIATFEWDVETSSGDPGYKDAGSALEPGHQYRWRVTAFKHDEYDSVAGDKLFSGAGAEVDLAIEYPAPSVDLGADVGKGLAPTDDLEAAKARHWAGYNGIYDVHWGLSDGTLDGNGIAVSEQVRLPESTEWVPAGDSAESCNAGLCSYNKPKSDTNRVYAYKAEACSPKPGGYCVEPEEVTVGVLEYPEPGIPPIFELSGPISDNQFTLQWSAPANTPPNASGDQIEAVTKYKVTQQEPVVDDQEEQPFEEVLHSNNTGEFDNNDNLITPYTSEPIIGTPGQLYIFELIACYEDENVRGCSPPTELDVYIPHAKPAVSHQVLDVANGRFKLTWPAPDGAPVDHYTIRESIDGGTSWSDPVNEANRPLTATEYTFNNKTAGEAYKYRVRACGEQADQCSNYGEHTVTLETAPGAHEDLRRTSPDEQAGTLDLEWNAPAGHVAIYQLQQKEAEGDSQWTDLAQPDSDTTTAQASGLTNGVEYQFRLRACSVADPEPGSEFCGAYDQTEATLAYSEPDPPTNLSATADRQAGTITVDWQAPANIDSQRAPVNVYHVQYQLADTDNWTTELVGVTAETPGAARSHPLTGLTGGSTYDIRVKACAAGDDATVCSKPTTVKTLYLPFTRPDAPDWLPTETDPSSEAYSQEDYDARRFELDWTRPAGHVDHYRLQSINHKEYGKPAPGPEADWSTIASAIAPREAPDKPMFAQFNREYGWSYYYRVRACSESGDTDSCSKWAFSERVRLAFPTPGVPVGLSTQNLDKAAGTFDLVWKELAGWAASQYRYKLQENSGDGWTTLQGEAADPDPEYSISGREPAVYSYHLKACNPEPDEEKCGDWTSPLEVNLYQNVDTRYRYDALGRLVQVTEDGSARRGYCYDAAGNRYRVAGSEAACTGEPPKPRPGRPQAPTGLSSLGHAGGGVTLSWNPVEGAAYYRVAVIKVNLDVYGQASAIRRVPGGDSDTYYTFSGYEGEWVQACNAYDQCGAKAEF